MCGLLFSSLSPTLGLLVPLWSHGAVFALFLSPHFWAPRAPLVAKCGLYFLFYRPLLGFWSVGGYIVRTFFLSLSPTLGLFECRWLHNALLLCVINTYSWDLGVPVVTQCGFSSFLCCPHLGSSSAGGHIMCSFFLSLSPSIGVLQSRWSHTAPLEVKSPKTQGPRTSPCTGVREPREREIAQGEGSHSTTLRW